MLDWKEGADSQIMGVPDMASDDGPCGATRDRYSIWVEVVLRGIFLEETDCLGAMIHDLEVVFFYMNEEGIINARESNSLWMVLAQHGTTGKEGLVTGLEPSAMEVDDQRSGLFALNHPQVKHTAVKLLAIAQISVGWLNRLAKAKRTKQRQ